MWYVRIIWDDDENPDGNVQHIAENGLTVEDVEHVLHIQSRKARVEALIDHVASATRLPAITLLSSMMLLMRIQFIR
jgi:hypothetical protein